jgi:WD40 repeat protein
VLQFAAGNLIHDIAWSPDGSQLAVAAGTKIHLYNSESLDEQHLLSVGVWTERLAFHPSLPILGAAVKDGTIRFWDTSNGSEICRFRAHRKGANSLSFQPASGSIDPAETEREEGLLVTTGAEIISRLWDISTLAAGECDVQPRAELIGSSHTAPDAAFSADGQRFALVDIRNVMLRESGTRKLIMALKGDQPIFDIALSPNGRWLAAAQSNASLALWDLLISPKPSVTTLQLSRLNTQAYTWRVDFSFDSNMSAGATSDGKLLVWQLPSLQPVFQRVLPDAISALAFKPRTHLLAVGVLQGMVYIYPVDRGEK